MTDTISHGRGELTWEEANLRHLRLHLDRLVVLLGGTAPASPTHSEAVQPVIDVPVAGPWVLDQVAEVFGLSEFERDVLVLAAGAEIDPRVGDLLGRTDGCPHHGLTFAVAFRRVPGAHWSALAPTAPLRRWRLVRVTGEPAAVVHEQLRIDDRVLLALVGIATVDATLDRCCRPLVVPEEPAPCIARAAEGLARHWRHDASAAVQVLGHSPSACHDTIALAAADVGMRACVVCAHELPTDPVALDELVRLVEREAFLGRVLVAVDADGAEPGALAALELLVQRLAVRVAVTARERLGRWPERAPAIEIAEPSVVELLGSWERLLPASEALADIAFTFPLDPAAVESVVDEARVETSVSGGALDVAVRAAARRRTRASLDGLARRVTAEARWEDLVLAEAPTRTLREMTAHVRRRRTVHHDWGFAAHAGAPTAVTALFHGPSGTGKTLAARVLATELGLDLYAVDLSQVVSKYIGETEKHLRDLFDRADRGSCVLLFDEADALFGTRSEVHDAHDRYANIEVSYLLQRLESYRGLAVLTSNLPANIDQAFVRRLRYAVTFPFPDSPARAEIWRRAFPPGTPVKQLDIDVLARLSITGASIASIALGAAVLAADDASPVTMAHLLRAARTEYAKGDRLLTATELQGWVTP